METKDNSFESLIEQEKKITEQILFLQEKLKKSKQQREAHVNSLLRKEVLSFLGIDDDEISDPDDVKKVTEKLRELKTLKKVTREKEKVANGTENSAPYIIREKKSANKNINRNINKEQHKDKVKPAKVLQLNAAKNEQVQKPKKENTVAEYENIPSDDINRARNSLTVGIQKSYNLASSKLDYDVERNVFVVNDNKTRLGFTQPRTKKMPTLRVDSRQRPTKASMWVVKENLPKISNKEPINTDPVGFTDGFTRGHLIARSLFDDRIFKTKNTKRTNLTPQTRWSNGVLQTEIENEVLGATRVHDNVRYQVEPMYHNSTEVIPRCYHIQARSRDGKFKLNVIVPNVEPGYRINYLTGTMTPATE